MTRERHGPATHAWRWPPCSRSSTCSSSRARSTWPRTCSAPSCSSARASRSGTASGTRASHAGLQRAVPAAGRVAAGRALVGALSAVAAAALFEPLARGHWGDRARWGALWFAAGVTTNLLFRAACRSRWASRSALALAAARCSATGACLAAAAGRARVAGQPGRGLLPRASPARRWSLAERRRGGAWVAVGRAHPARVPHRGVPRGRLVPVPLLAPSSRSWCSRRLPSCCCRSPRTPCASASRCTRLGGVAFFLVDTPMGGNSVRLGRALRRARCCSARCARPAAHAAAPGWRSAWRSRPGRVAVVRRRPRLQEGRRGPVRRGHLLRRRCAASSTTTSPSRAGVEIPFTRSPLGGRPRWRGDLPARARLAAPARHRQQRASSTTAPSPTHYASLAQRARRAARGAARREARLLLLRRARPDRARPALPAAASGARRTGASTR